MNRILLSFAVLIGAAALPAGAMAPVHVPLSGKQMSFDGGGKCVAGC